MTRPNPLLLPILCALCLVLIGLSLITGPVTIAPGTAVKALIDGEGPYGIILREIRLPRTLLAAMLGATYGLAGAALQGLLRNPLAEPGLFGAPQAAGVAAALVMAAGLAPATSLGVPLAAVAGAVASVGILVAIAGRRASLTVTLLAGLALASLAAALIALILNLAPNPYLAMEITFWLLGSLQDRSMDHVWLSLPFLLASAVLLGAQARAFRLLTLGEDAAASLGAPLTRVRMLTVIGVALGVGGCVAVAGSISFIGLIAPHLVRRLCGSDPARIMLPSALTGAVLLLAADIAVRLLPGPTELKIGVFTALIGVPFFIAIIFRERRTLEDAA